jgi:hypothetical protein
MAEQLLDSREGFRCIELLFGNGMGGEFERTECSLGSESYALNVFSSVCMTDFMGN